MKISGLPPTDTFPFCGRYQRDCSSGRLTAYRWDECTSPLSRCFYFNLALLIGCHVLRSLGINRQIRQANPAGWQTCCAPRSTWIMYVSFPVDNLGCAGAVDVGLP